jgi:hypothetical protein
MAEAIMERPIPTGEGLTFEKVWAMFQETREQMKETDKQFKEIGEYIKENSKELSRIEKLVKKNSELYGGLSNNFGAMAENMVGPSIAKRFNEIRFHFNLVANKGSEITDENGKTIAQVDILLENGETVIAVEVKAKPAIKDIAHHIKQLKIVREKWLSIKNERKRVLGAIAGAIFDKTVKDAVRDAGLFVIVQSGDTMKIEMTEGWTPVEF